MKIQVKENNNIISTLKPFIIGALSGSMASCVIQPVDTVKVQGELFRFSFKQQNKMQAEPM